MLSRELSFEERKSIRRSPKNKAIKLSYQTIELIMAIGVLLLLTVKWL